MNDEAKRLGSQALADTQATYETQLESFAPEAERGVALVSSVGKKLAELAENVADQEHLREWQKALDEVRSTLKLEAYDYAQEVAPNVDDATARMRA